MRRFAFVPLVVAPLALAACPPPAGEPLGVGHRTTPPPVATPADAGAEAVARFGAKDREGLTAQSAPFTSLGHAGGRFRAVVSVDAAARPFLARDARPIPAGAHLVMAHEEVRGARGPTFAMRRTAEGWRYEGWDNEGRKLALQGDACEGCHRDAPNDHVFPIAAAVTPLHE